MVLFQHGLMDSSDGWVMNYKWQAPAFMMSNEGYDVWFNNNRGNYYSCNHTTLDPEEDAAQFYSYDWDDLGGIDQPTVIDFILGKTGRQNLTYIGHSMGTT